MSGKRLDIDTYSILSAKDPRYPCQYCQSENRSDCHFNGCGKWLNWFEKEWRAIRRTFAREDIEIEPKKLHRVRNNGITKTPNEVTAKGRKEK